MEWLKRNWMLILIVVLLAVAVWGIFFQKETKLREVEVPVPADLTEVENRLDELQEGQEEIVEVLKDLPEDIALAISKTPGVVEVTVEPTAIPSPTAIPATPTAVLPTGLPAPYESEGGIPYTGTTWVADVAPKEIEVLTAGPASIAGVNLPGGFDRGSVIVLLPAANVVIRYEVIDLIAGSNWHGAYAFGREIKEADWRALANDRVMAMQKAPNCTAGTGCRIVDVLVVNPNGVVDQWTVGE